MPLNNGIFVIEDENSERSDILDYAGSRNIKFIGCTNTHTCTSDEDNPCDNHCSHCTNTNDCLVYDFKFVGKILANENCELCFCTIRPELHAGGRKSVGLANGDMFRMVSDKKQDHIKKVKEAHCGRNSVHKKHKKCD